ncbi:hypothetical protein AADZ90_011950 [Aestuariibius sp. 2305UL40-4]|uniref:hypothetical protein n=1 Tax=Aestuariibius violaceus TaxID=3234132 RepID=UPI00348B0B05
MRGFRHWYIPADASASWRSGYAADCKSCIETKPKSDLAENCCQDIPGTPGEPDNDTVQLSSPWHDRAGARLAASLRDGSHSAWLGFSDWIEELLTAPERASIAWSALKSLNADEAEEVIRTVLRFAGYPPPKFVSHMSDARWWAGLASRAEKKAYMLAAFEALSEADQKAFLNHVNRAAEDAT